MKLLRYGNADAERPGALDAGGEIRDLSSIIGDVSGAAVSPSSLERLGQLDLSALPIVNGNPRLGPGVGSIGKFFCNGLNYSDHAVESGMALPSEPILFMKATSAWDRRPRYSAADRGSKRLFLCHAQSGFNRHAVDKRCCILCEEAP
jgi:2-keto-4-pentenoate hydratase/2-oxohepta-3-ene-1,7-dioic acid hydratase in catechol pathway